MPRDCLSPAFAKFRAGWTVGWKACIYAYMHQSSGSPVVTLCLEVVKHYCCTRILSRNAEIHVQASSTAGVCHASVTRVLQQICLQGVQIANHNQQGGIRPSKGKEDSQLRASFRGAARHRVLRTGGGAHNVACYNEDRCSVGRALVELISSLLMTSQLLHQHDTYGPYYAPTICLLPSCFLNHVLIRKSSFLFFPWHSSYKHAF